MTCHTPTSPQIPCGLHAVQPTRGIGELKRQYRQKMIQKGAPKRVRDYGFFYHAGVLNQIARGRSGRTGIEEVTGTTPDISKWLDFDFYDRVWWLDKKKPSTMYNNVTLG